MQKLADTVGIKIIGMQKEDGTDFTKEDQKRLVLTTGIEIHDTDDLSCLPSSLRGTLHFSISELIAFLDKCRAEGKTDIEFSGDYHNSPQLKIYREELIAKEQYVEYMDEQKKIAEAEIMASNASQEEKETALKLLAEDQARDMLFVDLGYTIKVSDIATSIDDIKVVASELTDGQKE